MEEVKGDPIVKINHEQVDRILNSMAHKCLSVDDPDPELIEHMKVIVSHANDESLYVHRTDLHIKLRTLAAKTLPPEQVTALMLDMNQLETACCFF